VTVDVRTQTTIRRPIGVVSSYAADPTNAPAWYVNIDSVEWQSPPAVEVGSKVAYTYELTDVVDGERLVMRTAQGPFPMETSYTWSAVDADTTRMTLRNRGEPAGFSRLAGPFMSMAMRRANRKDLRRLKEILETHPTE
jgi:uncharacterized membrane protein